jgi:anti-sigma-K factor RskA
VSEPGDMSEQDCARRNDAAAYVLGALDDQERFRDHLATCAGCRAEVAELQGVVDLLAETVDPLAAPTQLRASVMASVRAEAEVLSAAGARADRPSQRARRRWTTPLSFGAAGAAVAAAVAVAVVLATSGGSKPRERVREAVLTASESGARAKLVERHGHGELVLSGMRQAPRGQIFEIWLLKRGAKAPTPTNALFGVSRTGNASVAIPGELGGVSAVLVTHEPIGGSSTPTSAPFLQVTT